MLVALCIMLNAAAFAWLIYQYPRLPEFLPLHYDSFGGVDFVGTKGETFKIPAIGTAIWVGDALLALVASRLDIVVSRLLLIAGLVAQVLLLVAVITITS